MDSNHGRVPSDKREGEVGGYTCGYMPFSIFKVKTLMVYSFTFVICFSHLELQLQLSL